MGALGKMKMDYKRGSGGAYHTKGQPMNTKERRKRYSLSKTTMFSNPQGISFLGEKEDSRKTFVLCFKLCKSFGNVYDSFHFLSLYLTTH